MTAPLLLLPALLLGISAGASEQGHSVDARPHHAAREMADGDGSLPRLVAVQPGRGERRTPVPSDVVGSEDPGYCEVEGEGEDTGPEDDGKSLHEVPYLATRVGHGAEDPHGIRGRAAMMPRHGNAMLARSGNVLRC